MSRWLALVALAGLLGGCAPTIEEEGQGTPELTLTPDNGSTLEAGPGATSPAVFFTAELNRVSERDTEFFVWSDAPEAVLHPPMLTIPAGDRFAFFSVVPNPAGSSVKGDRVVHIHLTGGGLRAQAVIHLRDVDPVGATIDPSPVDLSEAGPSATLSLVLDVPATENALFAVDNPLPEVVAAPPSITVVAGTSTAIFTLRALADANTLDETLSIVLRQVSGTDQTVEIGATVVVRVADDDQVSPSTSGSNPSATFAGADTVWESGVPTRDDLVTLVVRPRPPAPIAFEVGASDAQALEVLNPSSFLPQSVFLVDSAGTIAESATVTFLVRARQDPDRHSELVSVFAVSIVGVDSLDNTNASVGGFAGLTATRQVQVVDDDIIDLVLERTGANLGETLFVVSPAAPDVGDYRVGLVGGVAQEGGILVLLTSSDPSAATIFNASQTAPISSVLIAQGTDAAFFRIVPTIANDADPRSIYVEAEGVSPPGVQDTTLRDLDHRVIVGGEVSLAITIAPSGTIVEGGAAATVSVEVIGNIFAATQVEIEISDPGAVSASASSLNFTPASPIQTFTVTGLSDPDIQDEAAEIRVFGGFRGQYRQAVLPVVVDDDDVTLAITSLAISAPLVEGATGLVTVTLNAPVPDNFGDLRLSLVSSNPNRVAFPDSSVIVIPVGASQRTFRVTALAVPGIQQANIIILVSGSNLGHNVGAVLSLTIGDPDAFAIQLISGIDLSLREDDSSDSSVVLILQRVLATGPAQFGVEISDPGAVQADRTALLFSAGSDTAALTLRAVSDPDRTDEVVEVRFHGSLSGNPVMLALTVSVVDDENVLAVSSLTIDDGNFREGETAHVALALTGPIPPGMGPLTFLLQSSDLGRISFRPDSLSVVLEEGQTDAVFPVIATESPGFQPPTNVSITTISGGLGDRIVGGLDVLVFDDDAPGILTLSAADSTLTESSPDSTTILTISLDHVASSPILLSLAVSNPSRLSAPPTIGILQGSAVASFPARALRDLDTADDVVLVTVMGSVDGVLASASLVLRIADADRPLDVATLTLAASPLPEGETTRVTVSLNQPLPFGALLLNTLISPSGGLSRIGGFAPLVFATGATDASFDVAAPHDSDADDETVAILLQGLTLTGFPVLHVATISITDDDGFELGTRLTRDQILTHSAETLRVFLSGDIPEGEVVDILVHTSPFERLLPIDPSTGTVRLNYMISSILDTVVVALVGQFDDDRSDSPIRVSIDASSEALVAKRELGVTLRELVRVEVGGLASAGASLPLAIGGLEGGQGFALLHEDEGGLATAGFSSGPARLGLYRVGGELPPYITEQPTPSTVVEDTRALPVHVVDGVLASPVFLWQAGSQSERLTLFDGYGNFESAFSAEAAPGSRPTILAGGLLASGGFQGLALVPSVSDTLSVANSVDNLALTALDLVPSPAPEIGAHSFLNLGNFAYNPGVLQISDSVGVSIMQQDGGSEQKLLLIDLFSVAAGDALEPIFVVVNPTNSFPIFTGTMAAPIDPNHLIFSHDSGEGIGMVGRVDLHILRGTARPRGNALDNTFQQHFPLAVYDHHKGTASSQLTGLNPLRVVALSTNPLGSVDQLLVATRVAGSPDTISLETVAIPGDRALRNTYPIQTGCDLVLLATLGDDGLEGGGDDELVVFATDSPAHIVSRVRVGDLADSPACQPVFLDPLTVALLVAGAPSGAPVAHIVVVDLDIPAPIEEVAIPELGGSFEIAEQVRVVGSNLLAVASAGRDGFFGTSDDAVFVHEWDGEVVPTIFAIGSFVHGPLDVELLVFVGGVYGLEAATMADASALVTGPARFSPSGNQRLGIVHSIPVRFSAPGPFTLSGSTVDLDTAYGRATFQVP